MMSKMFGREEMEFMVLVKRRFYRKRSVGVRNSLIVCCRSSVVAVVDSDQEVD